MAKARAGGQSLAEGGLTLEAKSGFVGQLFRYACIGTVINVACYLLYLGLTVNGVGPKVAATIGFSVGVLAGFVCQRRFTFRHGGDAHRSIARYLVANISGYGVNVLGLYVLVDVFRYSHEFVQAVLVVTIAAGLFVAQKVWVFAVSVEAA
jgi:putative flippase GtrA